MTSGILRQACGHVHVDATTVDLVGEAGTTEFEPDRWIGGLVAADPDGDGARILTGQEIGLVHVAVELWSTIPPLGDTDDWQDIAEVSVMWRSTMIDFGTAGDSDDLAQQLAIPTPGDYRLRVYGRHRDDGDPREEDEPAEEYLIQLWTEPRGDALVVKQTSTTAHYWSSREE